MSKGLVCVFGANGFLGHYVVRNLAKDGWRVRACVRRPHIAGELKVMGAVGQIQLVQANIRYKKSVEQAVQGCDAVINLAGILVEQGRQNFSAVHVLGAKNVAEAAKKAGIKNLVHLSALGANARNGSNYAHSKAKGEKTIATAIPSADIVRPSILFGEGDGFFTRFARLSNLTFALPLLGGGTTKFQPLYVDDLAKAICKITNKGSSGKTWELAGAETFTFKQLMSFTLGAIDKKRLLIPIPWNLSHLMGAFGEISGFMPFVTPFLTRDQVVLLRRDNIVSGKYPGLADLDIKAETIVAVIPASLAHFRKYGQFHQASAH